MRIAFDLDQIFIDKPPFIPSFILEKFYKEKDNGELKYRIPGKIDQKLRLLIHFSFLRKPIWDNINFLEELNKNKELELYLISSRYKFLENKTKYLINKYQLASFFKKIYINTKNEQPHVFKNSLLKREKINIYFDDDLSLLKYIHKNEPKIKLFWVNNDPKKKTNHIQTIKKLNEFLKLV